MTYTSIFYDSRICQYLYIFYFLYLFLGWFYNLAIVHNNFQVSLSYTDLYVTEES